MKASGGFIFRVDSFLNSLLWMTVVMITTMLVTVDTCTDVSGVVKNGQTCSELVTATNSECYDTSIETQCCASCAAVATNVAGCQYGDSGTCFAFLCPGLVDPSVCCDTCNVATTTTSTTSSTASTTSSTSSSTQSSTTTPSTLSISSSTSASVSPSVTISPASITPEQSKTDTDDEINVRLIVGSVFGGVATAIVIIVGIIIGVKLYKRSKRQVDPVEDEIPPKQDKVPLPDHLELYSTPTMVVIDTEDGHTDKHDFEKNSSSTKEEMKEGRDGTTSTTPRSDTGGKEFNGHVTSINEQSTSINNKKRIEGKFKPQVDNGERVSRISTSDRTNLHIEELDHSMGVHSDRAQGMQVGYSVNNTRDEILASKIQEESKFTYPKA